MEYNDNESFNDKRKKKRRVYSTALIDELIREKAEGYDIPMDAFFDRDVELRASDIPFRMTEEEQEIYQKCFDDPIYFIENYCHFMTDKGLRCVKLRDFQRDVVSDVTAEVYDEDLDDFIPENRNYVWMASRQSSKCLSPLITIDLMNKFRQKSKISFLNLYYKQRKICLLDRLKIFLFKIYKKLS